MRRIIQTAVDVKVTSSSAATATPGERDRAEDRSGHTELAVNTTAGRWSGSGPSSAGADDRASPPTGKGASRTMRWSR